VALSAIIMTAPAERDGRCVLWIPDFASAHRDAPCIRPLQAAFPTLVPVHGPVLTIRLNQEDLSPARSDQVAPKPDRRESTSFASRSAIERNTLVNS
jgi:hypothetical protein